MMSKLIILLASLLLFNPMDDVKVVAKYCSFIKGVKVYVILVESLSTGYRHRHRVTQVTYTEVKVGQVIDSDSLIK